jgi:hypothetical protein
MGVGQVPYYFKLCKTLRARPDLSLEVVEESYFKMNFNCSLTMIKTGEKILRGLMFTESTGAPFPP